MQVMYYLYKWITGHMAIVLSYFSSWELTLCAVSSRIRVYRERGKKDGGGWRKGGRRGEGRRQGGAKQGGSEWKKAVTLGRQQVISEFVSFQCTYDETEGSVYFLPFLLDWFILTPAIMGHTWKNNYWPGFSLLAGDYQSVQEFPWYGVKFTIMKVWEDCSSEKWRNDGKQDFLAQHSLQIK